MSCTHDTLASYKRDDDAFGLTHTKTVQRRFAERLRGVLGRINGALTRAIVEDELLGIKEKRREKEALMRRVSLEDKSTSDSGTDTLAVDDPGPFEVDDNPTLVARFIRWFRDQLQSEYLTVVGRNDNQYVRKAYAAGIRFANRQLDEANVVVDTAPIDDVVSRPKHARMLRRLSNRVFKNLESLTEDMVPPVREALVEGLNEGKNPREIARDIRGRVDSIGKHRSTMIARSETINAYSESSIQQYRDISERQDIDIGLQHGDWQATPDNRTCPFCRRLSGATLTFDEMQGEQVRFRGSVFRLQPPAHVNGRCAILPTLDVDTDDLPPLEERVPGTVI